MKIKERRPSASFATAPLEILLQIAKATPDIPSLYYLSLAVPSIFRLWKPYGKELIDHFLSNRAIITPQVRDLIWLVALLRTDTMPVWSFDTFLEKFVRRTTFFNCAPESPYTIPEPDVYPFSVLGTTSRIYHLTNSCIEYYLEKLRAVQPKLQRPLDPLFSYTDVYGPYQLMVPGWLRQTQGSFYETPCMDPASWIEQQSVFLACWRFQLFLDLKLAAKKSRMNGWSKEEVDRIAHLPLEALYNSHPFDSVPWTIRTLQEVLSVHEYLAESERHRAPLKSGKATLDEIPEDAWTRIIPEKILWPNSTRQRVIPERIIQSDYAVVGPRPEFHTWIALPSLINEHQSPIKGISIAIFRRLGFAFWDNQRLMALGLYSTTRYKPVEHFWFQWRSMLSEKELAETIRRLSYEEDEEKRVLDWWIGPPDDSDTPHNKHRILQWDYYRAQNHDSWIWGERYK